MDRRANAWSCLGLLLAVSALTGCTTTQTIGYDTKPIARSAGPRLNVAIDIAPFRDVRRSNPQNAALFRGDREVEVKGKSFCVNAEEHYESRRVSAQLSAAIGKHLRQRGVFASVGNRAGRAAYRLSGVVSALYGEQETSGEAQAGQYFGLIGALATSGATSKGRVVITLSRLQIHDAAGRPIAALRDVHLDYRGELPADAYCWAIYANVNSKLREAVDALAIQVELAVRHALHPPMAAPRDPVGPVVAPAPTPAAAAPVPGDGQFAPAAPAAVPASPMGGDAAPATGPREVAPPAPAPPASGL